MYKFVLIPTGSAGDVHPFIFLGKLLAARGHEVVFLAQEVVRHMPEGAGLKTIAWGRGLDQEALLRNPDLWHPRKAIKLITRELPRWSMESIPVIREQILDAAGEPVENTVMIAGALAFGARALAEKYHVPLLTAHLQPSIFMSSIDTPVMIAKGEFLPKLPRFLRKAFFDFANWQVDRWLGKGIEDLRVSVGLPKGRIKGLMKTYWNSPDGVICLFPEIFAPKAADWPPQAIVTRFPLYDEDDARPVDAEVEKFLNAGTPPVVITPGSANAHGQTFIRNSVAGCALIGRRALVVTRYPETVGTLPAGSAAVEYVPFGRVFGRGAVVVHHGGVGTTAQCLAAGVPQLIMPMAHDQPDNAARVKRMGVGDYVYPGAFSAKRVGEKLRELIGSEAVAGACRTLREKVKGQMTEGEVGEVIESLAQRAVYLRRGVRVGA